jgi:transcriptional regulator with XRE-family HTH domain
MRGTVHQRRVPNRRLQELRINHGLSQRDLARAIRVSPGVIVGAESGASIPSPRYQRRIADALGVEPLDIWPLAQQRVAV